MAVGVVLIFLARLLLVALFLPFSALDKILGFRAATAQAREAVPNDTLAVLLIVAGLSVEVLMSLAVLTGAADRAAALVLAAYCIATALLWKQFWRPGDLWSGGASSKARGLFWDFWKNLAVAGGFLMLTLGSSADSAQAFLAAPLASSHPYQAAGEVQP